MVDINESIKTFKTKFLHQAVELTNQFSSLVDDSIGSIYYTKNWENEEPMFIEGGKCHHVPFSRIFIELESGKRVILFDSNEFSEYGGTFGISIRELDPDETTENLENIENQTHDANWNESIRKRITSVKVLWLDDDGWASPKMVNGRILMIPNKKSQGIYPHGIELIFENGMQIYILAVEPDELIESENRYNYLRGREELMIVFGKEVARRQKMIIDGIELGI